MVEVKADALFAQTSALQATTRTAFCAGLDAERLKRRQGEKLDGEFGECPKYADLEISPADGDKDGRFETIIFVASPYVAGPYVEGEYEITLPVTQSLIAALKADYRASFQAQPSNQRQ